MMQISYPKLIKNEIVWSGEYGYAHKMFKNSMRGFFKIDLLRVLKKFGIKTDGLDVLENDFLVELIMALHRQHYNKSYYDFIKSEAAKRKYLQEYNKRYNSDYLKNEIDILNNIGSGMGYSQIAIAEALGYCQQSVSVKIDGRFHPKIKLKVVIEYLTDEQIKNLNVLDIIIHQDGKTTGQRLTERQKNNLKNMIQQGFDKEEIKTKTGISMQTINKYSKEWGI